MPGSGALYSNTTGGGNTASGTYALFSNTTGSNNTALGYTAGPDPSSPGLTNATAIGAFADVTQNNSLVLGSINGVNGATASTNVGIGTTAPQYVLDVNGTGNFTGLVKFAASQTFPGTGTITGVTAGTDLTGGGTSGTVTLNVDTTKVVTGVTAGTDLTGGGTGGVQTLNLDTTKVPQLAAANTFTGAQTINNNVTITAAGNTLTASGGTTGVSGSGTLAGFYGTATLGGQAGVYGIGTYGLYGYGTGSGSYGVYGYGNTGVSGQSSTNDGINGIGVAGQGYTGVYGIGAYGLYGYGTGSGSYGVYGYSPGFAGYFSGNLEVTGAITAGTKDFKIDHPLDPANKYLYHASVESSEMKNIYDGNVILDKDGAAWVTLPDYFGALNRDFRYQLTAVGAPGPNLYIAQEIANNRFQIAGGTPGGKVSWQVTGIRQDAFAQAHPIIPEVEKTGEERGKYLHPVEHGQPKEMGIDQSRRAEMLVPHQMEPPKPPQQAAVHEPPK